MAEDGVGAGGEEGARGEGLCRDHMVQICFTHADQLRGFHAGPISGGDW